MPSIKNVHRDYHHRFPGLRNFAGATSRSRWLIGQERENIAASINQCCSFNNVSHHITMHVSSMSSAALLAVKTVLSFLVRTTNFPVSRLHVSCTAKALDGTLGTYMNKNAINPIPNIDVTRRHFFTRNLSTIKPTAGNSSVIKTVMNVMTTP